MTESEIEMPSRARARRIQFLKGIEPEQMHGIEIGALHRPTVTQIPNRMKYVDFTSTERLKELYKNVNSVNIEDIADVDHVWAAGSRLVDVVNGAKFDYALASHVFEHVPNIISWLQQIAECLNEGGILSLIIPDKRFTFDCLRDETSLGEIVGAFLQGADRPTPAQVFNHLAYHARVDNVEELWLDEGANQRLTKVHTAAEAMAISRTVWETKEYYDVHCTILTPSSAVMLFSDLFDLSLVPLVISEFEPTHRNEIDFFISLVKYSDISSEELMIRQKMSVANALAKLED